MAEGAGHWVTLNGGDGAGQHVFIGGDGTIEKGPAALTGKKIHELRAAGHHTSETHHFDMTDASKPPQAPQGFATAEADPRLRRVSSMPPATAYELAKNSRSKTAWKKAGSPEYGTKEHADYLEKHQAAELERLSRNAKTQESPQSVKAGDRVNKYGDGDDQLPHPGAQHTNGALKAAARNMAKESERRAKFFESNPNYGSGKVKPEWEKLEGHDVLRVSGSDNVAVPLNGKKNAANFVVINAKTRQQIVQLKKNEVHKWLVADAESHAPSVFKAIAKSVRK